MGDPKYLLIILIIISMGVSGCINTPTEKEDEQGFKVDNPNFILSVTNQAGSDRRPIFLQIYIDNQSVIGDEFIADQHLRIYHEFNLSYETHSIMIYSQRDDFSIENQFIVSDKLWGYVNYWGNISSQNIITFDTSNRELPII